MVRGQYPFNGKRYLVNLNTCEVHDLNRETSNCRIDEIKHEHIRMCDTYEAALVELGFKECHNLNGCYYCMPEKNTD